MTRCPVCQKEQNADEVAFNHHVNSHFAEDSLTSPGPSRMNGGRGNTNGRPRPMINGATHGGGRETSTGENVCCPICNFPLSYVSSIESTKHINQCLNTSAQPPPAPASLGNGRNLYASPIEEDQDFSYDSTTARTNGQSADDNWVEMGWEGPAKPGAWSDWVSKKVDKGDKWWDPVNSARTDAEVTLPSNFSPGVVPVLQKILQRSSAKNYTQSAVLCRDVVHIKSALTFDIGWGCGYRNALMAITSLIQAKPAYRKAFSINENGSDPGVRRIQGWIEEAWSLGFDLEGKKHFKGKMLGSHKWIGTSDLYAMFSYKGIPCNLYDFVNDKQKPTKNAHNNLVRWVKEYFDRDRTRIRPGESAVNVMMRTSDEGGGRGDSIRSSARFPLVLQHSGHSRLIIGYEEASRGETVLLVLDPGKTMHKDIRAEGIASLAPRNRRTSSTSLSTPRSRHSSRKISHESLPFARPYTNGESELTDSVDTPQLATSYTINRRSSFAPLLSRGSSSSTKQLSAEQVPRLDGGAMDTEEGVEELEDEFVDEKGWVRKKVKKVIHPRSLYDGEKWKVPDALQAFRVSAHHLSNHSEYQVLEFTGGPPLTPEERLSRKKIKSTCIK